MQYGIAAELVYRNYPHTFGWIVHSARTERARRAALQDVAEEALREAEFYGRLRGIDEPELLPMLDMVDLFAGEGSR